MARTPRQTAPRTWTTLALAGAAVAAVTSPVAAAQTHFGAAPDQGAATLWLAQAEGGEGGEAGATATMADDVAYMAMLANVDGHLRGAVAAYRQGLVPEALGLAGHPQAEVMGDLLPQMATRGVADITPQLDTLVQVMADGQPIADVDAAYGAAQDAIATAMGQDAQDAKDVFAVALALLKDAADEYDQSLADGKVADAAAWEEAHGFVMVASDLLAGLAQDPATEDAMRAANAAVAEAATLFAYDGKTPQVGDSTILFGAVARVELAGLKLQ